MREIGCLGPSLTEYSSLYLWREKDAFRRFLSDGGFDVVTRSFGRSSIRTYVALEARRGAGTAPKFLSTRESEIPVDADLTAALAAEGVWCREAASDRGTVAATVGMDTRSWRMVRLLIRPDNKQGEVGLPVAVRHERLWSRLARFGIAMRTSACSAT
ncbi:DUF4865 family protein [Propylenella binzhouense]|uniref:DUF4865 family protein n=1 Tax=Propylenella binzhouense TaxID=2555902 RepID=UPI0013691B60